jgi:acetoin utilization deacetylase AcuC-like enzyme
MVRRLARRFARFVGPPPLSVVFDERYRIAVPGVPMDPGRGAQVLAFLLDRGLVRRRDVHHPLPTSLRNLLRVHTADYLDSLQDAATLTSILGVPVPENQVAEVLALQRLMVGGTIQAVRLAVARRRPAVHLGGGFHHAAPSRGMGFCVYNDVAVAIRRLQAKGFRLPVLVVDLDIHHGNGTRAAFADDPTVHTYSIHNQPWDDLPAIASTDIALGSGVADATFLAALRDTLPEVLAAHRPGLVVYVAGVDPARDDHLGDWALSGRAMLERDRFVVEQVRARCGHDARLAVVLGGGYGHNAWRYTARFLSWLAFGHAFEPPDDMELTMRRYRGVVRRVDRQLTASTARAQPEEPLLTAADLFGPEPGAPRETRVLGRYTPEGFELLLERVGIFHTLRTLGYASPLLDADWDATGLGQTLRVYGEPDRRHLLIEMRLRRDRRLVPGAEVIFVEWLLLQNPRGRFRPQMPPLPGQQYPGLGLLGAVVGTLALVSERLGIDGVVNIPSHFYVAAVGRKHLRFLDPMAQARFEALSELFEGTSLAEAERLLDGRVVETNTGRIVRWEPAPMVIPVGGGLRHVIGGPDYEATLAAARAALALKVLGRPSPVPRVPAAAGAKGGSP